MAAKTKPVEERIRTVKAGDRFLASIPMWYTILESAPECKADRHNGRWVCVTHGESLENQLQKDAHIHTGRHILAWLCGRCGNLEAP